MTQAFGHLRVQYQKGIEWQLSVSDQDLVAQNVQFGLDIDNTYTVLPFIKKISNDVGLIANFEPWRENLSFLPTKLDIFDMRQKTLFVFYLSFNV